MKQNPQQICPTRASSICAKSFNRADERRGELGAGRPHTDAFFLGEILPAGWYKPLHKV